MISKVFPNRKGASIFIEQIFIILFGIFLLIMVILTFSTVRDNARDFIAETHFRAIGAYVHSAVVQATESMESSNYGRIVLVLPQSVGGTGYKIYLNNTTIQVIVPVGAVNSTINVYKVNYDLSGNISSTAGGRQFVTYNRTAATIKLETEEKLMP